MSFGKGLLVSASVFCVGVGFGISWKLGLIPFEFRSPATGTVDTSGSPSTDDSSGGADGLLAKQDDEPIHVWAADQEEPPVQEGVNRRTIEDSDEPDFADPSIDRESTPPTFDRVRPVKFEAEKGAELDEPTPEADDPADSPSALSDRFAEVDEKLAAGEVLAAHKLLSRMYWTATHVDAELQRRLDATAAKIFFSPQPHFIEPHVVQTGDQLRKIAAKYNLSWEYLAALNKTDPRRLRAGQKLKVLKGPFAAIVSLHDFSLTIHLQGYYVKRYEVGIGKDNSSPIGKFTVLDKIENPQYTDPDGKVIEGDDPKNPLGERWIDLGDSYGIHGTIDPDSIGRAESRGCIRLRDADVIEVYNFLVKGSVVEIRE